jgi:hypothetical protein
MRWASNVVANMEDDGLKGSRYATGDDLEKFDSEMEVKL